MGVYSTELFNNLGLCSYYAQQYDVAVDCFTRALELASDDEMADVWYNIGHLAVVSNADNVSVRPLSTMAQHRRTPKTSE